ncbi:MAG: PilZ domain-containing protein [Phycisphaerales bacterium JB054]
MAGRKTPVGDGGATTGGFSGDAGLPKGVSASRRAAERVKYEHDGIVTLTDPDGSPMRILFRDISELGVGLLYSGPMEPGARCAVQLKTLSGKVVSVPAVVIRCRSQSEFVNEIGVRFDEPINLRDFVRID